jgi:RNA polymerase sigma factor (sigma-70 family)
MANANAGDGESLVRILVPVFEETVLPHLDAAYNLARWLTHNEKDAEDVAQEAFLRAIRHFGSFKGGDARPWLMAIVRNTFYTWIKHNRTLEAESNYDDGGNPEPQDTDDPETLLLRETDKEVVRSALLRLPVEFREVIVLREFEEMSYKQIADVVQVPCGTVMSRLARARRRLAQILVNRENEVSPACQRCKLKGGPSAVI